MAFSTIIKRLRKSGWIERCPTASTWHFQKSGKYSQYDCIIDWGRGKVIFNKRQRKQR